MLTPSTVTLPMKQLKKWLLLWCPIVEDMSCVDNSLLLKVLPSNLHEFGKAQTHGKYKPETEQRVTVLC